MPHVFVIMFIIMILVTILSYIVPNGQFATDESGAINPDQFSYIENDDPISFQDFFSALYTGFVNGATIMGSLLLCSGSLGILNHTGALSVGITKLSEIEYPGRRRRRISVLPYRNLAGYDPGL